MDEIRWCDSCHLKPADFQCGGCHKRYYCSRSCQRADWLIAGHSSACCSAAAADGAVGQPTKQVQIRRASAEQTTPCTRITDPILALIAQLFRVAFWLRTEAAYVRERMLGQPERLAYAEYPRMAYALGKASAKTIKNKKVYGRLAYALVQELRARKQAEREAFIDKLIETRDNFGEELAQAQVAAEACIILPGNVQTDQFYSRAMDNLILPLAEQLIFSTDGIRVAVAGVTFGLPIVFTIRQQQHIAFNKQEFLDLLLWFFAAGAGMSQRRALKLRAVNSQIPLSVGCDADDSSDSESDSSSSSSTDSE